MKRNRKGNGTRRLECDSGVARVRVTERETQPRIREGCDVGREKGDDGVARCCEPQNGNRHPRMV